MERLIYKSPKGGITMLLENKVVVIYGAGGPIGGAEANAFAREEDRSYRFVNRQLCG
jgi:hypothetical protein